MSNYDIGNISTTINTYSAWMLGDRLIFQDSFFAN